ncbi:hypothetical protein [Dysgonomonas gadei]|uniref:hypothetical protein n=1 Tax=Dysgonomonas gadei TaxID=156974 RepID=UPI003AEF8C0C
MIYKNSNIQGLYHEIDEKRIYHNDYSNPLWREKRNILLKKNNYSCSRCRIINPSLGEVELSIEIEPYIDDYKLITGTLALHKYNMYDGIYSISVFDDITIKIDFRDRKHFLNNKIVMPILQIHHLRYIEGKHLWEYDDKDLLVLCEQCHHKEHMNNRIPIYDQENKLIKSYTNILYTDLRTTDEQYPFRNFKSWSIVSKRFYDDTYDFTEILRPNLKIITSQGITDNINKKGLEYFKYFMLKYLPHFNSI